MSRIGIITNPHSRRNRRSMAAVRAIVRQHATIIHVEIDDIEQIPNALIDFASQGIELIGISGGDGTVQAVITAMLNGCAYERLPTLAVLPAGMTNLIAANVGLRGRADRALARLCQCDLANGSMGRRHHQQVLSLQRTPLEAPIHGMFMGTAAFYRMVMLARREVHPWGANRRLPVALSMAVAGFRLLARRNGSHGLWHGHPIGLGLDELPTVERQYLLFVATTLKHLVLGLMPFWGEGEGQLRYTSVDFPYSRLATALWSVARGQSQPWFPEAGYRSGRARECRLTLACPIIFDGEIVTPEPGTPLVIRADRQVTFWRDE